jgi:hypothetical protein
MIVFIWPAHLDIFGQNDLDAPISLAEASELARATRLGCIGYPDTVEGQEQARKA